MRLQRPLTSSQRSHRKPELDGGMRSSSVLGHSSQPAATFGFDSRKLNLEPKHKGTILRVAGEKTNWNKSVGSKDTVENRFSRDKDKLRVPSSHGEIRIRADTMLFKAEKQITNNPLLQGPSQIDSQSATSSLGKPRQAKSKPIIVHDISSISLPELCVLHNAFLNADEDKNGTLDLNEFNTAFVPFFSNPGDVDRLFMRIDADCDRVVSWEEILSFVLSQDDAKMSINAEYMKREFLYPIFAENSQSGGHRENAGGLVFLSEADRYVSYEPKGEILIWKVDDTDELAKFHRPKSFRTDLAHISGIVHLQHFYNSERLALFSTEKQLTFMDLMRESCKQSGVVKLDFSPYCFNSVNLLSDAGEVIEQALAFGDDRGSVHLFRANDLHRCAEYNLRVPNERNAGEAHLRSWSAHDRSAFVYKVQYCADIKLLISCSSDGQVVFSDVEKGCVKGDGLRHRSDVHDFVWLRKFQQLVSCGIERHIKVWQLGLKSPVEKLQGHQTSVQRLLWEGGQLVSLDASKVIIVWDMSAMLCVQRLDCVKAHPDHSVCDISYDARRNTIATLGRSICLWQAADRKAPNGHIHPITCALYNPFFEMVITADDSAEIRVWDLNTGAVIFCFSRAHVSAKGENVKVSAMTFDITLRRLITGAHDGSAKIWNFSTGQCLGVLEGFGNGEISSMTSMTIKPYNYIVACGWNKKVTFWLDAHSHQARRGFSHGTDTKGAYPTFHPSSHFSGHRDDILSMACHRETSLLVTGSFDGDIIIWKVESGTVRTRLILPGILSMQGDQKPIEQITTIDCGILAEAADTEQEVSSLVLIATIGGDEFIRIWSSDSGAELLLELKRIIDSDDHFVDAADLGLVGLCVCSRNKVMLIADTKQYVIVYDISKMIESSHFCVESRLQDLDPPEKACKFRSQSGPIVALNYINTRHLILICSQDCSITLWTILGEKMGNFGELSDWKLSKEMHYYKHSMDEAVFEGIPGMSSDKVVSGEEDAKSNVRGDQLKGGSMSKKSSSQFHSMKRRQSLKNKINLMRGSEIIGMRKSMDCAVDDASSFFLTGTAHLDGIANAEAEYDAEGITEVIEDNIEDPDVLKETAVSEPELWTDSEVSEADAPEEDEINYQLKESIDQILSRALSMKERGERFFEPGQPVVPAYQKIRISEISDVELPDNIAKRIILQKGQGKRPSGFTAVKRRAEV